jgi:two-component system, OmpR family, response regulator
MLCNESDKEPPTAIGLAYRVTVIRILMVEDDRELSAMVGEYLAQEGFVITVLQDGAKAVIAACSGAYAAVILDIMLPGLSGTEVLRSIRQTSRIPVVMLTARGDNVDRVLGLELGADDYLAKPFYTRELLARLRAVLRRSLAAPFEAETVQLGSMTLSRSRRQVLYNNSPLELTASEFNVLGQLLSAGDKVSTKGELSTGALGRPHTAYDRSLDVHVSRLRQKLETATEGDVEIETVRSIGYRIRTRT